MEELQEAVEREIMFLRHIQVKSDMTRRKELLDRHPYQIWQGKNKSFFTYIPDQNSQRGKRLIEKNSLEKVEDVVIEYQKAIENNPTIKEVFDEWNDRRLSLKKISGSTHLRNIGFFKRHYEEFGRRRIKDVTVDEWMDFMEEQIPEFDLSAKAFSGFKGVTKGMLRRAKRLGYISFNIDDLMADIDVDELDFHKTIHEDREEVFNEEEESIIISYLLWHLDTMNMCILLLFLTGMRVGEATTLKQCDIDSQFAYINVRRTETKVLENGRAKRIVKDFPKTQAGVRSIVVPKQWKWFIQRLYEMSADQEFVFEREDHSRYKEQSISQRLRRLCKNLGIVPKSPHKIRKTYASILLDSGIDRRMILEQMGHTNIGVTERNYHRNRKSIEEKADVLSSIPDLVLENPTNPTPPKVAKSL